MYVCMYVYIYIERDIYIYIAPTVVYTSHLPAFKVMITIIVIMIVIIVVVIMIITITIIIVVSPERLRPPMELIRSVSIQQ